MTEMLITTTCPAHPSITGAPFKIAERVAAGVERCDVDASIHPDRRLHVTFTVKLHAHPIDHDTFVAAMGQLEAWAALVQRAGGTHSVLTTGNGINITGALA